MFSQLEPSTDAPQDPCTRLVGHLQAAINRPAKTVATSDDWRDALVMLRALPLSGDASRLAVQRLNKRSAISQPTNRGLPASSCESCATP